jgi:hypothetical protein
MDAFHRLHEAIFDELERQGAFGVDAVLLARALAARFRVEEDALRAFGGNPRCVNGACDG